MLSAYSWLSMALGLAQMVLDFQKNFKPIQFYMLNNICFNNFSRSQVLGASLLSTYFWLSLALGLAQMVLGVWKFF